MAKRLLFHINCIYLNKRDWLNYHYVFLTLEQQFVQSKQHCYLLLIHCRLVELTWFFNCFISSSNFFFSSRSRDTSSWADAKQDLNTLVSSSAFLSDRFSSETLSKAVRRLLNSSLSEVSCRLSFDVPCSWSDAIEDVDDIWFGLFGKMLKTPSSERIMYIWVMFKSMGIGPGEVILTGGRSSFRCNWTLSKDICIGTGIGMISSSAKSAKPVTVLIDKSRYRSATLIVSRSLNSFFNLSLSLRSNCISDLELGNVRVWSSRNFTLGDVVWSEGLSVHARARELNLL